MYMYMAVFICAAKLVETGTYGGEEDDDVLFDEMVEEYDDEDDAIEAVSHCCCTYTPQACSVVNSRTNLSCVP